MLQSFKMGSYKERIMNKDMLQLIINGACTLAQIIASEIGKKK